MLDVTRWRTVRLFAPAGEVEAATGSLWEAGVAGIEERPTDRVGGDVELRAGTEVDVLDAVLDALGDRWEVEVVAVESDEWLDEWRRWARPWRAGRRLVVVPSWLEAPGWVGDDDLVLGIDPGRAFGSGAHVTTRLCLAQLEDRVRPGCRVLDVGCGSGVLAVAAARLGAGRVEAVDIDPEAVRATRANAERNGVAEQVRASLTPVDGLRAAADVVVANIGASTLVALAPALVRSTAGDGTLVLSGLLGEQLDAVGAAFVRAGARQVGGSSDGDWRALVLERPRPPR